MNPFLRFFDRVADRMLASQEASGYGTYNAETGEMASHDWCRFRGDRHCYVPVGYETNPNNYYGPGTVPTDSVRPPADRGFCPFEDWLEQARCKVSEPGPNSGKYDSKPTCVIPRGQRQHTLPRSVRPPWT